MAETDTLVETLMTARAGFLFQRRLVSVGCPKVDGFQLTVEPPWRDFEQDEVLRLTLTSAAVLPIVTNPLGVLLVKVLDKTVEPRWEIPSGSVKDEDCDIEATAVREFYEETGLEIPVDRLVSLTYARHGAEGGIQFMAAIDVAISQAETDNFGRVYFPPFRGALMDEIEMLAVEPIGVFMSRRDSLLGHSKNPWAYKRLRGAFREKLGLVTGARGG